MEDANLKLNKILIKLTEAKKFKNVKDTARWLIYDHEWKEILARNDFYKTLGPLLRQHPLNLSSIKAVMNPKDAFVLGGFGGTWARIADFFKAKEAEGLIMDLLSSRGKTPSAEAIDAFIQKAVKLAIKDNKGKPVFPEAGLFASVLLTSVFPDYFVDFRQARWKSMALEFGFDSPPADKNYGRFILWAGDLAKKFSNLPVFKNYFATDDIPASWVVAGLSIYFTKLPEIIEIIKNVPINGPVAELKNGVKGMQPTATEIWEVLSQYNPQIILQGPPGSGKTFLAEEVIEHLAGNVPKEDCRLANVSSTTKLNHLPLIWDVVQFHPSYTYEDFIRGLATEATDKGIMFKTKDRILAEAAGIASANPGIPVILILDEINRADLARVFGELIYVLERDRRGLPVSIQYGVGEPPNRTLVLPRNLYLIGTMNSSDRSIAMVDYALRRRFSFFSILPDTAVVRRFYEKKDLHGGDEANAKKIGSRVSIMYEAVYNLFDAVPDADDIRIGHSYFLVKGNQNGEILPLKKWTDAIAFRFAHEVLPMLVEYRKEKRIPNEIKTLRIENIEIPFVLAGQKQTWIKIKNWLME